MDFKELFSSLHNAFTDLVLNHSTGDLQARIAYAEQRGFVPSTETLIETYLLSDTSKGKFLRDRYVSIFINHPETMTDMYRQCYMYDDHLRRTSIPRYEEFLSILAPNRIDEFLPRGWKWDETIKRLV
jgi:hypothetical protein